MGVGIGIVLVVIGLILLFNVVQYDIPNVNDNALGWILLAIGILAIVLALVINGQRTRSKHIEERRYDDRSR